MLAGLKARLGDIVVGGKLMNKVDAKDRPGDGIPVGCPVPAQGPFMRTSPLRAAPEGYAKSRNRRRSAKSSENARARLRY